jgi:hypothetical protein
MSETDPLSLADLERSGRVWGTGRERRALCPFCGDEHGRDHAHACLAVNVDTGAWTCHRCERRGLLAEHRTPRVDDDPLRPKGRPRRRPARRSATPPVPREPTPAELADAAGKRATLRRLWAAALAIDAPAGAPGAAYLASRAIPLDVAAAARVRYAADWYGRPSVVFPLQDGRRLVAAEGRYTDGGTDPKGRSAGPKSSGVFAAAPGALAADGVTLCEGPITALAVAACGFPAVALCGHVVRPWLTRRLAMRAVFVSLDWYEEGAEEAAATACRALAALGARPYRLAPPAGAGDWADYLQAVGVAAMRAALDAALCGALVPRL